MPCPFSRSGGVFYTAEISLRVTASARASRSNGVSLPRRRTSRNARRAEHPLRTMTSSASRISSTSSSSKSMSRNSVGIERSKVAVIGTFLVSGGGDKRRYPDRPRFYLGHTPQRRAARDSLAEQCAFFLRRTTPGREGCRNNPQRWVDQSGNTRIGPAQTTPRKVFCAGPYRQQRGNENASNAGALT